MSQSSQLLALLGDGEWWTTRELLREVPCIVHSRISDLRGQGHVIEHETIGVGAAGSRYRLIHSAGERPLPSDNTGVAEAADGAATPAEIHPDQLSLEAA